MKIYLVTINGKTHNEAYRSLKKACDIANIPYWKAVKGIRGLNNATIIEAKVVMNKQRNSTNNKSFR